MRHRGQIHRLLRAVGTQHRKTGLPAGVNIGMITENVQRVRRNAAGGNMDNARQQLAGDFIHIGDHQQQSLRRRIGGGQRTGCQSAVHRAGRAAL